MAEIFLIGITKTILEKLGSLAVQQIGEVVGATKELEKLRKTLETIQAVRLDADADHQLHHQMNNQLKVWLQRLKDVCSRAEDVLDDFEIAALKQQLILKKRRNVRKKQKVVIRVDMTDPKKSKAKAMKIAATFPGVESVAIKGDDRDRLEVIGNEMDIVQLAKSLRKNVGSADLISVGPAKE